jgi:hypothetical protein
MTKQNPVTSKMDKIDNKKGAGQFLVKDNRGAVYYIDEHAPDNRFSRTMGELECMKCYSNKPFEQLRWDAGRKLYVCLDCLAKQQE